MANALERVRKVRPNEAVMSQQSYERMDAIARKGRMLCDTYREPYQSIQHQAEGTLVILHERKVVLQKLAAVCTTDSEKYSASAFRELALWSDRGGQIEQIEQQDHHLNLLTDHVLLQIR